MPGPYYSGRGDDGTSTLFGNKERLTKDSAIFELLGSLDELNCWIGVCRAQSKRENKEEIALLAPMLERIQQSLFTIQAHVASADKHLQQHDISALEADILQLADSFEAPTSFCLPGGSLLSSQLDLARSVARRCERYFITANRERLFPDSSLLSTYLNRLSSLLYVLVRYTNAQSGITETAPHYGA